MLFAIKINLSSFSFRDKQKWKIKMMKKYFKEEKVKKGEVINTKRGHQIRAFVKISLVMLDPVSLFKKKKKRKFSSDPLFCQSLWSCFSTAWRFLCQSWHLSYGVRLICHDPPPQFTALTEDWLQWSSSVGNKKNQNGCRREHILSAGIRFLMTPLD